MLSYAFHSIFHTINYYFVTIMIKVKLIIINYLALNINQQKINILKIYQIKV